MSNDIRVLIDFDDDGYANPGVPENAPENIFPSSNFSETELYGVTTDLNKTRVIENYKVEDKPYKEYGQRLRRVAIGKETAANLLTNSDFTDELSLYDNVGASYVFHLIEDADSADNIGNKIAVLGGTHGGVGSIPEIGIGYNPTTNNCYIPVKGSTEYTLCFYVKARTVGDDDWVQITMKTLFSSTPGFSQDANSVNQSYQQYLFKENADAWEKIYFTFTTHASDTAIGLSFAINNPIGVRMAVEVAGVMLVEGDTVPNTYTQGYYNYAKKIISGFVANYDTSYKIPPSDATNTLASKSGSDITNLTGLSFSYIYNTQPISESTVFSINLSSGTPPYTAKTVGAAGEMPVDASSDYVFSWLMKGVRTSGMNGNTFRLDVVESDGTTVHAGEEVTFTEDSAYFPLHCRFTTNASCTYITVRVVHVSGTFSGNAVVTALSLVKQTEYPLCWNNGTAPTWQPNMFPFILPANSAYVYSFYARHVHLNEADDGVNETITIYPTLCDIGAGTSTNLTSQNCTLTTEWQQFTISIPTSSVDRGLFWYAIHSTDRDKKVIIDFTGFMVQKGTVSTQGYYAGDTPGLDNITQYVLSADWQLGSKKLDNALPFEGTASIKLNNTSKYFSPANEDSPYYGLLKEGRAVFIEHKNPSTNEWEPLWSGWTDEFSVKSGTSSDQQAIINCVQGIFHLAEGRLEIKNQQNVDAHELAKDIIEESAWKSPFNQCQIFTQQNINYKHLSLTEEIYNLVDNALRRHTVIGANWTQDTSPKKALEDTLTIGISKSWIDRYGKFNIVNAAHWVNYNDYITFNNLFPTPLSWDDILVTSTVEKIEEVTAYGENVYIVPTDTDAYIGTNGTGHSIPVLPNTQYNLLLWAKGYSFGKAQLEIYATSGKLDAVYPNVVPYKWEPVVFTFTTGGSDNYIDIKIVKPYGAPYPTIHLTGFVLVQSDTIPSYFIPNVDKTFHKVNLNTDAQAGLYTWGEDTINQLDIIVKPFSQASSNSVLWSSQSPIFIKRKESGRDGKTTKTSLLLNITFPDGTIRPTTNLLKENVTINTYNMNPQEGSPSTISLSEKEFWFSLVPNGVYYLLTLYNDSNYDLWCEISISGKEIVISDGVVYSFFYDEGYEATGIVHKQTKKDMPFTEKEEAASYAERVFLLNGVPKGKFSELIIVPETDDDYTLVHELTTGGVVALTETQVNEENLLHTIVGEKGSFVSGHLTMKYIISRIDEADYLKLYESIWGVNNVQFHNGLLLNSYTSIIPSADKGLFDHCVPINGATIKEIASGGTYTKKAVLWNTGNGDGRLLITPDKSRIKDLLLETSELSGYTSIRDTGGLIGSGATSSVNIYTTEDSGLSYANKKGLLWATNYNGGYNSTYRLGVYQLLNGNDCPTNTTGITGKGIYNSHVYNKELHIVWKGKKVRDNSNNTISLTLRIGVFNCSALGIASYSYTDVTLIEGNWTETVLSLPTTLTSLGFVFEIMSGINNTNDIDLEVLLGNLWIDRTRGTYANSNYPVGDYQVPSTGTYTVSMWAKTLDNESNASVKVDLMQTYNRTSLGSQTFTVVPIWKQYSFNVTSSIETEMFLELTNSSGGEIAIAGFAITEGTSVPEFSEDIEGMLLFY